MLLRRALFVVLGIGLLVGLGFAGVAVSMGRSFSSSSAPIPPLRTIPSGRLTVAVALGSQGSVTSDALAPFDVFASSPRFFAYTVSSRRDPVALSGGLHAIPDHTFDEALTPDVVVVPAVVDTDEQPLRDWIKRQAARGAHILGVCAGAELLAKTGLLDGLSATTFWSDIGGFADAYPAVHWVSGQRYVARGLITTTAGVTSGIAGALHVLAQLAGDEEASRVGAMINYPGWSLHGSTAIPVRQMSFDDLPYAWNVAFPWFQPTWGIRLADRADEIDVAAAFETYGGASFAARLIPLGPHPTVTTRHGLVLVIANSTVDRTLDLPHGYDGALSQLAALQGTTIARVAAKFMEYPMC
ncbi:DJ-1/PfpI family protein [Kutzneria buriramensis]|uniref:DJ-1/PfpI family protein n=1 Tax=Kutzneria buriramensis TaxID=1045776 RepID=A0A3E0GWW0_9PSEU|nr:DJ-1/PfpI family protein [Kutzneria buriramensis]REH32625.1 DJ-1/PfpI family protein [Kutzneria buriramensis]